MNPVKKVATVGVVAIKIEMNIQGNVTSQFVLQQIHQQLDRQTKPSH